MLERIFELLFKYRPIVFDRGEFAFAAPAPIVLIGLGLIALFAIWSYRRARAGSSPRDRVFLGAVRLAILAILLVCLMRPRLLIPTIVPQRNSVAVLIDDSRSMRIADDSDATRTDFVADHFDAATGDVVRELSKRFQVKFFRFSALADRTVGPADLTYTGRQTRIASALDHVRDAMAGVPVAGIVLVTDGADNSNAAVAPALAPLKAGGIPVFAVGVGAERFARDVQVSRVETPRRVLKGSSLDVDVHLRQSGYAGRSVRLDVEDAGRIVTSQDVVLPDDDAPATVRVNLTATESGARTFSFRIRPLDGELIQENNRQDAVVIVENKRNRILYFEGEPRFELKFLRRAVAEDPNLQVVALQRTAENKFLRIDVDSSAELEGGFPRTREELFRYSGLILGSVEASFFTADQLQMISDFVSRRGGGLVTLGGRHAFSEGGYEGTALEDVLPVELDRPRTTPYFAEVKAEPTRAGASHVITRIATTEDSSLTRWARMPALTTTNPVSRVKAGATTLLVGGAGSSAAGQVILAFQRFGRGTSIAMPVQDSWTWQMSADVPLEDQTHETFWRQLLRWSVHDVPAPVRITTGLAARQAGEAVTIRAEVDDDAFMPVNDAAVVASVTSPDGTVQDVPLEWTVRRDGEYAAVFTPPVDGMYQLNVKATRAGTDLGRDAGYFEAGDTDAEFFDAEMRAPLLRRVADETGGRFYTKSNVRTLAEDIAYTGRGESVMEEKDLWDMPFIFVLLFSLIAVEWLLRRKRGLA